MNEEEERIIQMSNLHIREEVANQIVHEYKMKIIDELKGQIERQLGSSQGGSERRTLMGVITLLEERNWYKSYNIAVLEALSNESIDDQSEAKS